MSTSGLKVVGSDDDINPWVELASQGRDVWNSFIFRFMGKEWEHEILSQLPDVYPKQILETLPLPETQYSKYLNIIIDYFGDDLLNKLEDSSLINMDFSSLRFEDGMDFNGFVFIKANFSSVAFEGITEFENSIFF